MGKLTLKSTGLSRKKIRRIMNEIPNKWIDECDRADDKVYLDTLIELDRYISKSDIQTAINIESRVLSTNMLSNRQEQLSDLILEYITRGIDTNLAKIYFELYDYIDNYNSVEDEIGYIELILFKKIVRIIIKNLS